MSRTGFTTDTQAATAVKSGLLYRLIHDRKGLVDEILGGRDLGTLALALIVTSILFLAIYGGAMGLHANPQQAAFSALKLPLVFLATLTICFPPLYLLLVLIGSELGILRTLALTLMALTMGSFFLATLTPLALLFTLSDVSREFLTLLHAVLIGGACVVMATFLGRVFGDVSDETPLYPPHIRRVLFFWVLLIAFVGVQTTFLLLPFVGDEGRRTEFLRSDTTESSPYRHLVLYVEQVLEGSPWR